MSRMVAKPMIFVYVVGRGDGWHKIGCTGDVAARIETLSKMHPTYRPLRLVVWHDLGHVAPLIEKVAHADMSSRGYRMHPLEWFDASGRTCANAIKRAVKLIEEIGPDGWMKRRVAVRKQLLARRGR